MRLRGTVIGALNLFHIEPGDDADRRTSTRRRRSPTSPPSPILQHRAVLEAQVLNEQLNHALNTRIVIEQAKGMVAERDGLDMEQAFARLRNHARNHNLRLADVARQVIDGRQPVSGLERARPAPSP